MTRLEPERSHDASPRREVERTLAEAGLLRGPRGVASMAAEESFASRLRTALERLGPVFSAFGLYLASRTDLLPAGDCLELSELPDRCEPMPADAVRGLVAAELRRSPEEVFESFDPEPRESRLFVQAHAARLLGGEAVLIHVARPGVESWLQRDVPLLPLLGAVFADADRKDFSLQEALADFQATLPRVLDLTAQADALAALGMETEGFGPLRALRVHRLLTTPKVLVMQDLGGVTLDQRLREEAFAGRDSGELARRLCLVWLRQALLGGIVPVEPWGADVALLPGERIAFRGGLFAKLPSLSQRNLRDYLIAASNQDPEGICTALVREMILEGPASAEERFRLRLRQAVPFRDGGWSAGGESLAEHLFLHWRFARDCGFRPRPQLLVFCRGLTAVAAAARRMAPGRDALLEAFEEVRLLSSAQHLGELMTVEQLRETFERYAALMIDLPQKLDEVLTRAAEGSLRRDGRAVPGPAPARRSFAVWIAILLALAAIVLLAPQLGGGVWGERVSALLFLLFGAWLLRLVVRT